MTVFSVLSNASGKYPCIFACKSIAKGSLCRTYSSLSSRRYVATRDTASCMRSSGNWLEFMLTWTPAFESESTLPDSSGQCALFGMSFPGPSPSHKPLVTILCCSHRSRRSMLHHTDRLLHTPRFRENAHLSI